MNSADIAALVQEDRVHRDLYLSEELFALEQRHFFANTWNYAGHASQVPLVGDYMAVTIAGQPLLMVRQADGSIRVLHNRCAHKGTQLVSDGCGNAGKFLRCPYHAWAYKLDGAPLAIPMKSGYEGTRLKECESGQGMEAVKNTAVYRDFVFVKLGDGGPDFESYCGGALRAIDNLVERSPTGRLQVAGGVLRSVVRCNWKMYLENINDTVHPMSTHESATSAANAVWKGRPADAPKPMAMEQILPFGSGYDFFDRMGGRVYPNGHSVLGINFSIHSAYGQLPEYEAAMREAYGSERAAEILERSPQNAILYPSLSVKSSPQAIRVIRPLAADRTLVEAWSFRVEGGPDVLLQRSLTYNRLVFSPMSMVAHDDLHLFESIQRGLASGRNEWVSLHRNFDRAELEPGPREVNGTSELLMRNQFRAWVHFMTLNLSS
ncbi:aromatic ring-hydroxylating dioxygenase subunit alpha [Caenimonas soli]|uniref:aromatic ring-hydroxylating dioxygenase subunit alpha n=1 Tax=Caenimonas soli TaxID=2735555 RepID=UPI00155637F1|nr:Rieske 2Fe-2S domain-containing protein [Caenimonas soli]NPC56457.1 Rieske 2Fe-2S domain-containing protein [Caenimonas soli]